MKKYNIYLFIFLLLIVKVSFSNADSSTENKIKVDKQYLISYPKDIVDIFTIPFHINKKRLINYGIASASITASFFIDKPVQSFFLNNTSHNSVWVSEHILEPFGSGIYSCGALSLFFIHGVVWDNNRSKFVALNGLKTFLVASFIAQIPKFTFRRERPYKTQDHMSWFNTFSDRAFVSGHTTAAFAFLSSIALEYKEYKWLQIGCYTVAGLSGLSRVHDNKHWLSDVVGGAFLGYGIASLIHNSNNWGVQIYPSVSKNDVSLNINLGF